MRSVLQRLGFDVEFREGNGRDLTVVATLVERDRALDLFVEAGARPLAQLLIQK